jgi:hypothetical protein
MISNSQVSHFMTCRKTSLALLAILAVACGGASEGVNDELAPGAEPSANAASAIYGGFVGVSASSSVRGYPPTNAVDSNLTTRWTASGKGQYITGDLGATKTATGLYVAWYRGSVRRNTFQILALLPDGTVQTAYSGQSSGTTDSLERYDFAPVSARYLRVVVNGNTENNNASILELSSITQAAAPAAAPAVAVGVSPSSATVARSATQPFTASVTGTSNTGVTWSIQEGAAGGAVSSAGLYTAPSSAGTFHVVATSVADPTKSAMATVSVAAAPGVTVAAPNGSDDTASFNAAITQANGGTVNVAGSGTYLVRAVAVNKAGTSIVCDAGAPATLKLKQLASGDGSPILNVTAGNFTLTNCILDGNKTAQPSGGFNDSYMGRSFRTSLKMDGSFTGLTVDRATFKNAYGAAIAPRGVNGIRVTNSTFQDNNFESIFSVGNAISGDPTNFLTGFTFTGNTVKNCGSGDASVNSDGLILTQTGTIDIENNTWDGFERNAMKLENCRDGTIANNTISNGKISNFAGIGTQNGAHSLTISGNKINNVGTGIDASLVANGQHPSDKIENLTIRGNTITNVFAGAMPDGIRVLGYGPATTDVTITGNVLQSVPRNGINVEQFTVYEPSPVFTRITIQNNTLTSAGSCNNWFWGTDVQPTSAVTTPNTCQ